MLEKDFNVIILRNYKTDIVIKKHPAIKARVVQVGKNTSIDKTVKINCESIDIANNVIIAKGARLKAKIIKIGEGSIIGTETTIHAGIIEIGRDSKIDGDSNILVAEVFRLGNRSDLCKCIINGRNVEIGDDFFSYNEPNKLLVIGEGGSFLPTSNLSVGNRCVVHDGLINIAMPVKIGNDVGISNGIRFFTHYFWNSVLEGHPQKFSGITISDGCIIGADSFFLPGVTIGKECNVGARSVVTKSFPDYCLIAGNPAKIKKRNYRKNISSRKRTKLLRSIFEWYAEILETKGFVVKKLDRMKLKYSITGKSGTPIILLFMSNSNDARKHEKIIALSFDDFSVPKGSTILNLSKKTIQGFENELTDDLRDFLRKSGIRIYSNRRFRSIPAIGESW